MSGRLSATRALASGSVVEAMLCSQAILSMFSCRFSAIGVFGLYSVILSALDMCNWSRRNLGEGGLGGAFELL